MHDITDKNITLTPLDLISSIGVFDLDPCGLDFHMTAKKIISLPVDGLREEWAGKVWLNPPYSNTKPFMEKLAEHGNGVALVLNSTDAGWFHMYGLKKATSVLFLDGRPKFTRMDYSRVSIMRGVLLFAYGHDCDLMLQNTKLKGVYVKLKDA